MGTREILLTSVGEMRDMIACLAIYNGAPPKPKKKKLTFLETLDVL